MFDAIILAGGGAARLGGTDKAMLEITGVSLLDRVIAAVADAEQLIVVGPARPLLRASAPVTWRREHPAGGGPVAALAAALPHGDADIVVTLAADLPSIGPAVPVLLAALGGSPSDCAALVDGAGRVNYLAAAWRRESLARALAAVGEPNGAAMRSLVAGAMLIEVPDGGGWGLDCDTWDDIDRARSRMHREGTT